ncbi:GNAT family N-acetyltransferase [Caballeronia ptereochthonis]|uniref:GNAT family N-acetyltransferase n=1 Tax=Caballeronia ptereochthonis TaxID=1777144 RepID=UPI001FC95586|nr:GNAT family protein [Caballeronia ptereochthonis]
MTTFPTLTTSRLSLRELLPCDAPSLFAVHGDAEGMRWFGTDPMTDIGEADNLIEVFADWWRSGSGVRRAVERLSDGLFLPGEHFNVRHRRLSPSTRSSLSI